MLVTRRAATGQCPGRARREGASSPESERQRRDGLEADGHAPSACWTEGKSTPLAEPCSWTLCPRIRESGPPAQASVGRFGAFKNLMRKAQGGRGAAGAHPSASPDRRRTEDGMRSDPQTEIRICSMRSSMEARHSIRGM